MFSGIYSEGTKYHPGIGNYGTPHQVNKSTMEQVGDGDINTTVDMADSVVREFKDGGNSDGDVPADIALIDDQGEKRTQ